MYVNPQKATLRQVASSAGVSLKTASRVLNNEPFVRPDKKAAVRAAIKRLAYEPNQLARSLKMRRSGVIGVVVPFLSHSFMAGCIQAIHRAATEYNFTIMATMSSGDANTEAMQIRILLQHQVEGLIIFPTTGKFQSKNVEQLAGMPVVIVDQPTSEPNMDSILVGNRETAQKVIDHLLGHGYQSVAVIGANRCLHTISERVLGYREAMRLHGWKTVELVPALEEELSVESIAKLFKPPAIRPRAVFTLNSAASIKTLHAIKSCHLQVPEDVALFGFDDFDTAESFQPSISVVSQPVDEIGKSAVDLLFQRIRHERPRAGQKIVLIPQIILRASCGCIPLPS